MDASFRLPTPHLQSSAARLHHLLFEVMALAMPPVAYSFVTKSCPALHTFARAGRRAGTRGETQSQMSHGSCVHEPAGIAGERCGHPVLLSYLRTSAGLARLPVRPYGVSPVLTRPCRSSKGREGLTNRADGRGGPVPKTGPYPPNQAARHRPKGALLAPGRCDVVEHRVQDRVTGQRPPGRFDQPMAQATDTLAADVAPPHRCPRGVRTGRQAGGAQESPRIGKARHSTPCGRSSPCDDLADAWDTPIDGFERRLGLGLLPQQPADLQQLAGGKAPLVGQEREADVEFWRQRPRRYLPSVPAPHQAPTARRDEATLVEFGCDLARQGGAVRDQLGAGAGEETRPFLGFCRDIEGA